MKKIARTLPQVIEQSLFLVFVQSLASHSLTKELGGKTSYKTVAASEGQIEIA